jgi:hypothetical protein
MRDNQRSKVYAWENDLRLPDEAQSKLTLKDCERLAKRVYKAYGKPCPRVADGRGHRRATGSQWTIQLPKWARTGAVVLHECAHGLQEHFAPRRAAHGPEFVAIFAELLNMIYGCSLYWLEGEAIKFRVSMAVPSYKPEHVKARAAKGKASVA